VLREHTSTPIDCGDEAIGDIAVTHMGDEDIDSALPMRLRTRDATPSSAMMRA
jgi:hypothetical protein